MIGIYFSGTGNTKYCVEQFLQQLNKYNSSYSIESKESVIALEREKDILFAYPVYYSNIPKIVRDYIYKNADLWKGKNVFLIATMGLFSGDGTGVSARLLKKYEANIMGGLHLKMPDSIADEKALKRSIEANQKIVKEAENKIKAAVKKFEKGEILKEGLTIWNHLAGLFGQRLYFYGKTKKYSGRLKIKKEQCIGCSKCIVLCPMKNLSIKDGKAEKSNRCTMCYSCVNNCPKQAITLLGKKVVEQGRINKYLIPK